MTEVMASGSCLLMFFNHISYRLKKKRPQIQSVPQCCNQDHLNRVPSTDQDQGVSRLRQDQNLEGLSASQEDQGRARLRQDQDQASVSQRYQT